jgi:hypothetical protein
MDPFLLRYSADVFRKYLTGRDYRIKKNDIFDSILARYCEDYIVMTFDKRFYLSSAGRTLDISPHPEP